MPTGIVLAVSAAVLVFPALSQTAGPVRYPSSGESKRIADETGVRVQYRAARLSGPELEIPPAAPQQPSPPAPETKHEPAAPRAAVVEQIVAKVNNDIITLGELERSRKQIAAELMRQKLPPAQMKEAMQQAEADLLRDRIDQMLLVQKAKDLSINVDQELSKYLAQLQLESKITDPDKFQQYIREGSGMSFEDFKQQARDSMMTRDVVRREVGGRIVIPRTELQKYYEEHKNEFIREEEVSLREIFISTEGKDAAGVAAAEKKAKDLVARARKNENFANLARDNSDADSARNYGELPPFKRGMLKKELEDLVFAQEKGYVTDPLKQPNGFLIVKVEEHPRQGLQPFESVENDIMEKLYMPRMQPAVRTYLTKLREEAFLEIRQGFTDSGAAPGKDTSWKDPARLVPATVTKEEVVARVRRKRLLWLVPVPGTKPKPKP
jgi:peptidyl-prolyl cis-trans isomerase SurA